jgi:hypothetical protein
MHLQTGPYHDTPKFHIGRDVTGDEANVVGFGFGVGVNLRSGVAIAFSAFATAGLLPKLFKPPYLPGVLTFDMFLISLDEASTKNCDRLLTSSFLGDVGVAGSGNGSSTGLLAKFGFGVDAALRGNLVSVDKEEVSFGGDFSIFASGSAGAAWTFNDDGAFLFGPRALPFVIWLSCGPAGPAFFDSGFGVDIDDVFDIDVTCSGAVGDFEGGPRTSMLANAGLNLSASLLFDGRPCSRAGALVSIFNNGVRSNVEVIRVLDCVGDNISGLGGGLIAPKVCDLTKAAFFKASGTSFSADG